MNAAQARNYLAKAKEYLAASENELEAERGIARRAWQSTPPTLCVVFVSVGEQSARIMTE